MARRGRLGGGRARQPPHRVPVERVARRPRGRDRRRRARRADGVLGPAVRDARLGRGAARAGDRGRRAPTPPPLHRRRLRVLRGTGRGRAGERAPGHRAGDATSATTRARPGTRRSSRRSARCTAATSTATSSSPARSPSGTAASAATACRPTSTGSSRPGAPRRRSRITEESVAVARDARQPVLDRVLAVDRGHGVLPHRAPPGARGLGRGHEPSCASSASSSSRASSRATRRGCTPSDGEPAAALGLFAEAITAFQRAGNVPAADHHARQRARVVRAARPARAGGDAARRAGERAVERAPRPRARRARRPDRPRRSARSAPSS